jgi:hypothetical protein
MHITLRNQEMFYCLKFVATFLTNFYDAHDNTTSVLQAILLNIRTPGLCLYNT